MGVTLPFRNSISSWGWVSIVFHWLSAVLVIGLFVLGYWMVELDYYSQWYRIAPDWHKSLGVLLVLATLFRLVWRFCNPIPKSLDTHSAAERLSAKGAYVLLYCLLLSTLPTGYLIVTASGQALEVFNWFAIPSVITSVDNIEDLAGKIHEWSAYILIGLASVHALAALKHHFFEKDATLKRMLGKR